MKTRQNETCDLQIEKRERQDQNREIGNLVKQFVDQMTDFYNDMENAPVRKAISNQVLEKLKRQEIPQKGRALSEVYEEMQKDIYSSVVLQQHQRSFSCIPSTASLLSWMGDVMTNAYNPHASCTVNAPAADMIEKKLICWMCEKVGYPKTAGGLFVSGGSIANLTALTAARDQKLSYEERAKAMIYVSDQTHASVRKGLHIIGFTGQQIHVLMANEKYKMDMGLLEAAVMQDRAEGKCPFAVVASAGTTNTGSVDPLEEIGIFCEKQDLWMHVDGAFGASALLSEREKTKLKGIERSDSMSWDAHKWMLQTYGCSVVLVRDKRNLLQSFAAHPEYLKDAETSSEGSEFWDYGPELTRPDRGLKLWLTLQVLGSEKMGQVIEHGCDMAKLAETLIRKDKAWEILSPAQLGIVNFRYIGNGTMTEAQADAVNQKIAQTLTESGYAQIYTTELKGKKVLRICSIHPETTKQDICETIQRLMQIATSAYY